jgi:hypothetical protein
MPVISNKHQIKENLIYDFSSFQRQQFYHPIWTSDILYKHHYKYVDGIRGCTTQAFLGATIGRITELLSRGKINISNIDIVIIHVGTNNISSTAILSSNLNLRYFI